MFIKLQPPINDESTGSGFIGIKPTTTKNHLIRSVLEGIVYRLVLAFETLKKERNKEYAKLTYDIITQTRKKIIMRCRIDGGVSKNDFICQLIADLTNVIVERLQCTDMSTLGVGFLAGLSTGLLQNKD